MICIVGNKADLIEQQEVSEDEGRNLAKEIGGHFAWVSSKTGNGIEELFEDSIKAYTNKYGYAKIFKEKQKLNNKKKDEEESGGWFSWCRIF